MLSKDHARLLGRLSKACKGQRRAWLAAWKSIVARSRLTPDDL